jgi:hypothetical protein
VIHNRVYMGCSEARFRMYLGCSKVITYSHTHLFGKGKVHTG